MRILGICTGNPLKGSERFQSGFRGVSGYYKMVRVWKKAEGVSEDGRQKEAIRVYRFFFSFKQD